MNPRPPFLTILRAGQIVAWLFVLGLTIRAWQTPPFADRPDWNALGIKVTEGRAYRERPGLRRTLDVYAPSVSASPLPGGRLRPAVLFLHGGSWIGGALAAVRFDANNLAVRLAREGMVVFAIDYSLARPGHPSWPGVVADLREAVRWVRRNSAEFDVDPGKIAAIGQSSGGHLAALIGTLPEERGADGVSSRVQAVVTLYAPSDLAVLAQVRQLPHDPMHTFLGDRSPASSDRAAEASPINHVSADDPPFLLIHGTDDLWVPLDQSVRMTSALALAGVPRRLITVNQARHGFETRLETPAPRDLLPDILAFLENAWNISSVAVRLSLIADSMHFVAACKR